MIKKNTVTKWLVVLGLMVFSVGYFAGCSDDDDPSSPSDEKTGRVKVTMIDAPAAFEAVNIVVTEVSIHKSDRDTTNGWETIREGTETYNLLELRNGVTAVLGDTVLDVGHYNQIRLKVDEGSNVVVAGQTFDLTIPSGMQSGLKLNHAFTIEEDETYELTLDFDAEASIHTNGLGEYILNPVIRLVATQTSGRISGTVLPINAHAEILAITDTDTVRAYADTTDGTFLLMAIPEGSYDLSFEATQGSYLKTTISDVEVVASETTALGVITLTEGE